MYKALYRKYRPKTFDDVVGQNYVIDTLKNEILNDKINHAYMFFGPRGIGKTTIAKIFARAVNCENSIDGSPCEKCKNCIVSKEKECVDIIEIDAASNNGVDEIREIRNKVNLVPAELKYKVYIIDEVHMLTQGAFNALLKTLEEPPKHIIFILATTDPQKVSDTIISRCQCFSFKRIPETENFNRLKQISENENIEIDEEVLKQISLYSDGGLRDSLGILDKLSAYKQNKINIDDFYEMNDMIDSKSIEDLYHNIMIGDRKEIISKFENYHFCGKNVIEIMNQLLYYLKNKIVDYYINNVEIEYLDKTEKLLQFINERMFDIKKTSKPYIYVEILFIQFLNENKIISRKIISNEKINNSYRIENKKINNENQEGKEIIKTSETKSVEVPDSKKIEEPKEKSNFREKDEKSLQDSNKDNIKELMKIRINNTLAAASKDEKVKVVELIQKFNDYVFDPDIGYIASEILSANICAVSDQNMIISYEYDSVVEQNIEKLDQIISIFNKITGIYKKIAIISNKDWIDEKNKYIEFTKQGNKYKIIEEPNIQLESSNEQGENLETKSSAIELFGDIVEIK